MPELAWLNGTYCALENAHVSVEDRGYQFGDGVYEVVRSYTGRLWAVARHMRRFAFSLDAVRINGIDLQHIEALIRKIYTKSGLADAVVYCQVTRGCQPREHSFRDGLSPVIFLTVKAYTRDLGENYRSGVRVITVPETRWARRDIKSLNLLPNVLAKREAHDRGAFEAVFIENGMVTEATSCSLFIVKNGTLITRELGPHILAGVTRDMLLETAARQRIPFAERPFTREEMLVADEVFLAASTFGVMPVTGIDEYAVGQGTVGDVGRVLGSAYQARAAAGDDGLPA